MNAVTPAAEPTDPASGQDLCWIAYNSLMGLVDVKREIYQVWSGVPLKGLLCTL